MSRSLKKGPYIEASLEKRVLTARKDGKTGSKTVGKKEKINS